MLSWFPHQLSLTDGALPDHGMSGKSQMLLVVQPSSGDFICELEKANFYIAGVRQNAACIVSHLVPARATH